MQRNNSRTHSIIQGVHKKNKSFLYICTYDKYLQNKTRYGVDIQDYNTCTISSKDCSDRKLFAFKLRNIL